MLSACLAFSLTVLAVGLIPALPSVSWYLIIALMLFVISLACWRLGFKLCFCIWLGLACGWSWAVGWGLWRTQHPLINAEMVVEGRVTDLPEVGAERVRFNLAVDKIISSSSSQSGRIKKLRISWYDLPPATEIEPGQSWRFKIKAFRPHSFLNPNGFDYEGWMMQKGIQGNAYVREGVLLAEARGHFFSRLRWMVSNKIMVLETSTQSKSIIAALMIGDRNHLSDETWQLLFRTGISHLIAISGLHLTLVAGTIYLIAFFVFSRFSLFSPRLAAAWLTLFFGWLYALSVGFSLPTQRAALMLSCFLIAIIFLRRPNLLLSYVIALSLVLAAQPLAGFSGGFYLSFAAVAIVLLAGRRLFSRFEGKNSLFHYAKQLVRLQILLMLCLTPFSAFFFNAVSILGLAVNLIAIPITSFILMPWILITWALLFVLPSIGSLSLLFLGELVEVIYWFLAFLASYDWAVVYLARPPLLLIPLALIGAALWLLHPRPSFYLLGAVFFAPIFFFPTQKIEEGSLRVVFLDVGQGLAVHLQTANHNMLFDAGPRYSVSFDAGSDIIASYFHSYGLTGLDRIIISHNDKDHGGGLVGLLEHIKVNQLMLNFNPLNKLVREQKRISCLAGQNWQWDGVSFEVLHPSASYTSRKKNNRSCVILVTIGDNRLLLTGDIEKEVEKILIKLYDMKVNILQVPHHGSSSSSHLKWVDEVDPDYAVFSAGYRNPFSHPSPKVVERYEEGGSLSLVSWRQGAIEFEMNDEEVVYRGSERKRRKRYWHHNY